MKLSHRQELIQENWINETDNMLITAVAGSGKTTTLLMLAEEVNSRLLFLAFNTSIQKEIQAKLDILNKKLGKNIAVAKTMHSVGLNSVISRYKSGVTVKNGYKYDMLKEIESKLPRIYTTLKFKDKLELNNTILAMHEIMRLFLLESDQMQSIRDHMENTGKQFYDYYLEKNNNVEDEYAISSELVTVWKMYNRLVESNYNSYKPKIDYTDMIYLPQKYNLDMNYKPGYVMVDECQDLNLCQHNIFKSIIDQPQVQKWVAVGDVNQSIYGFTGADSRSFGRFNSYGEVKELPLDICYRSDMEIIASANQVYDCMEGFSTEPGIVKKLDFDLNVFKPHSLILCRNKAPLVDLFIGLLKVGMKPTIMGSDIMTGFNTYIKKHLYSTMYEVKTITSDKLDTLKNANIPNRSRINMLEQHLDMLNIFIKYTDLRSIKELTAHIADMISKPGNIRLSTIHKSKGLEADVVYILDEHLMPTEYSTTEMQLRQEDNLKYVGRTRAKHEMYFINSPKTM